ncbi:MAG: hypothetical protein EPO10_09445 [Reyranella sp.]|nr:MAG: hypothetical protein EPO10_09445 [Reyranella sp.]
MDASQWVGTPSLKVSGCAELPLAGIRVLEAAGSLAARYATRLLADVGAQVQRVTPRSIRTCAS